MIPNLLVIAMYIVSLGFFTGDATSAPEPMSAVMLTSNVAHRAPETVPAPTSQENEDQPPSDDFDFPLPECEEGPDCFWVASPCSETGPNCNPPPPKPCPESGCIPLAP